MSQVRTWLVPSTYVKDNLNGFKVGDSVVIDPEKLLSNEPQSWKNEAKIIAFVKDEQLTEMNGKLQIFRIEIEFEKEPNNPTEDDMEQFGEVACYSASVLPRLLRKVVSE